MERRDHVVVRSGGCPVTTLHVFDTQGDVRGKTVEKLCVSICGVTKVPTLPKRVLASGEKLRRWRHLCQLGLRRNLRRWTNFGGVANCRNCRERHNQNTPLRDAPPVLSARLTEVRRTAARKRKIWNSSQKVLCVKQGGRLQRRLQLCGCLARS